MLKRIELAELELGMFVQKMEGSWFDHPFWKAKFVVDDAGKLKTLKSSNLDGVVIDTSKGKDVAASPAESGSKPAAPRAAAPKSASTSASKQRTRQRIGSIKSRQSVEQTEPLPVSTAQELGAAQRIAETAKDNINKVFLAARLGKALNPRTVEPVINDILTSIKRNPQAFGGLMRCKLQNEFVYRHSLAVSALMISLARRMKLEEREVREAGMAGLFLDIGTNYLPQGIDPKDGDFRNAGPKIWQQHVVLGHRALQNDDTLPPSVLEACLHHHERLDGKGFPAKVKGDDIGRMARMAAICDSFDFMLTKTETTKALDPAAAIAEMRAMEGAFDPEILRHFVESVGLYPVGSFVELSSGKLALVIDEDMKDKSKPVVQAFYSVKDGEHLKPHRIVLARAEEKDSVIGVADLAQYQLGDEDHLREMIFLKSHNLE
jgi:HD-GYP domain-containing protein (c-di-GMP phosphodiesterase class II)